MRRDKDVISLNKLTNENTHIFTEFLEIQQGERDIVLYFAWYRHLNTKK